MPTLKYLGQSFDCAVAIKGADYIHLLDAAGVMTATFDGITDFSDYTLENGAYTEPTEEGYCKVAVVRDDGTIGQGTHTCADIGDGVAAKETVDAHVADETRHITAAERSSWNGKAAGSHTHTKSQITDFPSSMPASDVYAWAKKSTKPTYTASEVGAAAASHTHTMAQVSGLVAALAAKGNCNIETGSYSGTGTAGSARPTTLTFAHTPKCVYISRVDDPTQTSLLWIYGMTKGCSYNSSAVSRVNLTWSSTSVTWALDSGSDANYQLNVSGKTYLYVYLY